MNDTTGLSPTPRTSIRRGKTRAVTERERLHAFLADALLAHVGVIAGAGDDTYPLVLPTAFGVDLAGPDDGGTLYLHGSVAAGWFKLAIGRDVCVTITELDGLVAARSAFHHSMNYRSAVIIGRARHVEEPDEREHALSLVVDHMIPGRWATLRPSTRKELAATAVLALPLAEASMKQRATGPDDEPADIEAGTWGGHIPLYRVAGDPISSADSHDTVPVDVLRCAARFARLPEPDHPSA
ncbi:MAG TPA: pyridoxamine 5'-phosphate oxidase family protein [Pseudonocardiaceae bacterium]